MRVSERVSDSLLFLSEHFVVESVEKLFVSPFLDRRRRPK